jgi:acyl-CoA reductase-like NAD-dependent aldehyde dehydrogenase
MRTHGYSAAELSGFYAALDRAVREAAEHGLEVSIPTMVQRLFHAADAGERDEDRLISAIFGGTGGTRRAAAREEIFSAMRNNSAA